MDQRQQQKKYVRLSKHSASVGEELLALWHHKGPNAKTVCFDTHSLKRKTILWVKGRTFHPIMSGWSRCIFVGKQMRYFLRISAQTGTFKVQCPLKYEVIGRRLRRWKMSHHSHNFTSVQSSSCQKTLYEEHPKLTEHQASFERNQAGIRTCFALQGSFSSTCFKQCVALG